MLGHGILNLVDDCTPCCLYPQDLFHLDDMVGDGVFSYDSRCGHDLLESVPFDDKLFVSLSPPRIILFFDIDDGSLNARDALDAGVRRQLAGRDERYLDND